MTIENARKAGMLSAKLKDIDNMIYNANRAMRNLSNCDASTTIVIGDEKLYGVPEDIAIEVINLIIKRLKTERDKITTEIKAL